MKHLIAAACVAAALSACASSGNTALKTETSHTLSSKIAKGVTTQAQVRALLGAPSSTNFTDSGNQVWHYSHSKATSMGRNFIPLVNIVSSGSNVESKELALFFDKQGVVQDYAMQESKSQEKQGIVTQ